MTDSPLGKYAPLVATVTALVVICGYVIALVLPSLNVPQSNLSDLQAIAFVAIGAIFGSAVSVNGWRQPLNAVHKRLDEAGVPPAGDAAPKPALQSGPTTGGPP